MKQHCEDCKHWHRFPLAEKKSIPEGVCDHEYMNGGPNICGAWAETDEHCECEVSANIWVGPLFSCRHWENKNES